MRRVFARVGWLALGLEFVFALPLFVLTYFELSPGWLGFLWTIVVGSYVECVTLGAWLKRDFQSTRSGPDWSLANERFFQAVGVNFVANLVTTLGMFLCGAGLVLAGLIAAAIPITLFEKRGVIESLRQSWVRSEGRRVALCLTYFVAELPVILISSVPAVLAGLSAGTGRLETFPRVAAITTLLSSLANVAPRLFQVILWLDTRPPLDRSTSAPVSPPPAGTA